MPTIRLVPLHEAGTPESAPASLWNFLFAVVAVGCASLIGASGLPYPVHTVILMLSLEESGLPYFLAIPALYILLFSLSLVLVAKFKPRNLPRTVRAAMVFVLAAATAWVAWPRSGHEYITYLLFLQISGAFWLLPGFAIVIWGLIRYQRFTSRQALAFYCLLFVWLSLGAFPYIGEFP
jgi:hypothetical protein